MYLEYCAGFVDGKWHAILTQTAVWVEVVSQRRGGQLQEMLAVCLLDPKTHCLVLKAERSLHMGVGCMSDYIFVKNDSLNWD